MGFGNLPENRRAWNLELATRRRAQCSRRHRAAADCTVASVGSAMEEAVAAGADQTCGDEQHDAEDDLSLDELDNPNDRDDHGEHPEHSAVHVDSPLWLSEWLQV